MNLISEDRKMTVTRPEDENPNSVNPEGSNPSKQYRVLDPIMIHDRMWGVGDVVTIEDEGYAKYQHTMKKIAPIDSPEAQIQMHGHIEVGTGEATLQELLEKDPSKIVLSTSAAREMTPVDRTTSKPEDANPPGAGTVSAGADETANPNLSPDVKDKPGQGVEDQHPVNPRDLGKPIEGPFPLETQKAIADKDPALLATPSKGADTMPALSDKGNPKAKTEEPLFNKDGSPKR